ncbi:MAG TPA: protein-S-isoprenylcysteine O-methyltransferase, partial [Afifellaceae bacterium]|nr:protein-S-isoprenylcysteine O-methyltransferase [Afifellaceae bacterium]
MSLSAVAGQIIWAIGVVAWYVIRHPFQRRAKRVPVVSAGRTPSEKVGLGAALFGLAILPAFYVASGIPGVADYPASPWAVAGGALVYALALWVFRRSHKDLGRNWSITLEIREQHKLVSTGLYSVIRHPMYTAFLLMGLGQALLLANWVAGLAGLVGFAVLFFLRVDKEERMMLETFGPEYRAYMART